jgi:hypothetical protein
MASGPGTALRNPFSSATAVNRLGLRDFNRFGIFNRFQFHPPFAGFPFRNFDDFFFPQNPFFFNNSFFFRNPFFFNNSFFFNDFFFRRPFFGCFGCGFGFVGFNFGIGAPLWWGPGWAGWSGYPYGLTYGYSLPYDNSTGASGPQSDNSSVSGAFPRTPTNSSAILLFLKDGTMYSVLDCWLADGKLHYTATDRSEGVVELDAIDFQRTVDENARRGVPFTLKPNPASSKPRY